MKKNIFKKIKKDKYIIVRYTIANKMDICG